MSNKEIQDLLKLVSRLELSEFKMKDGEFSLSVRTKHFVPADSGNATQGPSILPVTSVSPSYAPAPAPAAPAPAAPAPVLAVPDLPKEAKAAADESNYVAIKSPMVGTFYRSPAPDKPIYVKVGDTIAVGDTVCIIEAMKLFNEVDAEVSGKIVKVLVEDAQPIEYDQVLFLVDPKG